LPEGPCGFEPLHLLQATGFAGGSVTCSSLEAAPRHAPGGTGPTSPDRKGSGRARGAARGTTRATRPVRRQHPGSTSPQPSGGTTGRGSRAGKLHSSRRNTGSVDGAFARLRHATGATRTTTSATGDQVVAIACAQGTVSTAALPERERNANACDNNLPCILSISSEHARAPIRSHATTGQASPRQGQSAGVGKTEVETTGPQRLEFLEAACGIDSALFPKDSLHKTGTPRGTEASAQRPLPLVSW
jgi:hypothetical protein